MKTGVEILFDEAALSMFLSKQAIEKKRADRNNILTSVMNEE